MTLGLLDHSQGDPGLRQSKVDSITYLGRALIAQGKVAGLKRRTFAFVNLRGQPLESLGQIRSK
jgi:hypothetical protein